ncbi:MAG: ethanolamine ammonia-lyase [Balneolales bacterium]|nr:ethanolamine ammonia-lyase [Balneolales bacterium]
MKRLSRKFFLKYLGLFGSAILFGRKAISSLFVNPEPSPVTIYGLNEGEDIFEYIRRTNGTMDITIYRQIIGSANPFKEGDETLGIAAKDESSRNNARLLLSNTKIKDLEGTPVFEDGIYELIEYSTDQGIRAQIDEMTMGELKTFVLTSTESDIKEIMPGLSSDIIGCLVKLMDNEELISVGQKVFNPLPGSNIGSKGYMSARIQPNSPTDNLDDIVWQVFCGWSYAVGDLVLGTNPVPSEPESVVAIEAALHDLIVTFDLEDTLPNCVLSHIDIQAEVESFQPGTTGIWFQSIAGTVKANQTFDVTIEKMFNYAGQRNGKYGMYFETGQGADFTNGHGEGFDMVLHESRKYGFARALKLSMAEGKKEQDIPWVHLNDVAGFIGPEVFKTKEQLVRTCLEDTVMGKLHGLPIGLDICSTLHMDVTLDDLDWCIDQIMPANPAYLMALPTKNDPMLSYLTTAFNNHVKVREKFGYKVNDAMWDFFKKLNIIDENGEPTEHFGDPVWVYYQYKKAKGDLRSQSEIYAEGRNSIKEIEDRGVFVTQGYGNNIWDLPPQLDKKVRDLYEDAKVSIWTELSPAFTAALPNKVSIKTSSSDRVDYVYHPESGEKLSAEGKQVLEKLKGSWQQEVPDVQILISDGLNARSLMDKGHLTPFLNQLEESLAETGFKISKERILITSGRVRAGYQSGEILFGSRETGTSVSQAKGIIHIIGERPGSGHRNFSAYLTAAPVSTWSEPGRVDHDISRVVSGVSDTALDPKLAAIQTVDIFTELFEANSG